MKSFKIASFRTSDRKALQLSAREFGHGLQNRTPSELANARRELAQVAEGLDDEFARGFFSAIESLLAGLSSELKHRNAVAQDVASLRKNASKVLAALHSGSELPSQVAEKSGLSAPAVSTELAELEREHLVERMRPRPGEDQRTSPRALTIRGMQVAEEVMRTAVSPTAEAARDLVPVFVSFINRLSDETFLAPQRFKEMAVARLGEASGAYVCDEFLRHAEQQRTISFTNSAFALTSALYGRRIYDLLQDALWSPEPPFMLKAVHSLASKAAVWLRATTGSREQWQVALSKHSMRNIHAWCLDDARTEQLPLPQGEFQIVWENPEVMSRDLDDTMLHSFVSGAARRHCYVAAGVHLPPGIERIEFDAPYVGR